MSLSLRTLGLAASALLVASSANAQSIWGICGPPAGLVNQAGPPAGACNYPTGPNIGGFPYAVPFGCPLPGPFPGPAGGLFPAGDVTVDRINDIVYASDGITIASYNKAGVPLASFPNPLPGMVTGLGWSAPNPIAPAVLWITNGFLCCAVIPPAAGCPGGVPFVIPPFAVLPGGAGGAIATDVDFDPSSLTLFFSHNTGAITNQFPAGGPGPFGIFFPMVPCNMGPLTGLAIDTAHCKTMYITNGGNVARIDFAGNPAPVTFYAPFVCWPWTGPSQTSGLGFDATPVKFGTGSDPAGSIPQIGTIGEALSPNPGFGLTLSNATPGGQAFLLLSPAPICPTVPVGFGAFIHVFPISSIVGPIGVPATGGFGIPAPIPAGFACSGLTAYVEWLVVKPGGAGLETSPGLHIRPANP
ncbi:MAG: hypothetical protein JNL94_10090 [Planctomycetes bacterium]|nr:hypothetical protein [Planctomycetota bacterium]